MPRGLPGTASGAKVLPVAASKAKLLGIVPRRAGPDTVSPSRFTPMVETGNKRWPSNVDIQLRVGSVPGSAAYGAMAAGHSYVSVDAADLENRGRRRVASQVL